MSKKYNVAYEIGEYKYRFNQESFNAIFKESFKKQKLKGDGQLLHAFRLELTHPTSGERMSFTAPLPPSFAEILQKLCKQYDVDLAAISYLFEEGRIC